MSKKQNPEGHFSVKVSMPGGTLTIHSESAEVALYNLMYQTQLGHTAQVERRQGKSKWCAANFQRTPHSSAEVVIDGVYAGDAVSISWVGIKFA